MNRPDESDLKDDPEHPGGRDRTELVHTESQEVFDRLARLAGKALRAPVALIGLASEDGAVAMSSVGLPEPWCSGRSMPLDQSLCHRVTTDGEPLVVEDTREDPLLRGDPAVEEAGAIAYAGLPLRSFQGRLLGCLCVMDRQPRRWSDEELDTLREFSSLVVDEVERSTRTVEGRERYLRSLIAGVHDIITVIDPGGTILYDSPSIERVLGYESGERVGHRILEFVQPEDREKARVALRQGREWRNAGAELEIRMRHRDGSSRVLEVRGRNLVRDLALGGSVLTARDVTKRVRMEEERKEAVSLLRSTLEATDEGILVIDLEGRVKTCNQRFLDLWRIPVEVARARRNEELLDIAAEQLVDPEAFKAQALSISSDPTAETFDTLTFKDGRILERYSQPQWLGKGVAGRVTSFRDVTERRRSDDATRKSEERLRLSLEIGQMGVWEWHIEEGRVEWSPELERVHGREPASFEGTIEAYRKSIHPQDLERVVQTMEGAVEARREYEIDYRIIRPDGEERWITARGEVCRDESGDPSRMLGICADVTERKQAAEAVRESRAFLRAVIDATPNLVFVQDRDGRYLMANEAVATIFGTTAEEVLGRSDQELGIAAEDAERFRREDAEVIESGELTLFPELPVTDPITGETRWYHKIKMPLEGSGSRSVQVLGVATDITERVRAEEALHESEERYRLITRATNDLLYDWTIATDEVEWNGAASVFGHTLEAMSSDSNWFLEHLHPDDRDAVRSSLDRTFQQGGESWSCEYRFRRPDGSYVTVLDRGHIVRDAAGEPVRMLGAIMDLTERRQLEEELREAQKMEAVGRLAGGVAHELNNALMEIKGNAQLGLVDLPSRDTGRAELETIEKAADRAASLTRQLMAFGRKQMLQPEVIELNEVVSGMETTLQRRLGDNVRIVIHLDPGAPRVNADPASLEEVLRSLVLNAGDAMPEGGTVRIETGVDEGASPLPHTWFSVSDTGAGMDEATLERIWEPFFTTREGRRGLGLSTVYGIVKQSGGEIHALSTPGEGSTFTVRLPVAAGDSTAPHAPDPAAAEESGADTILLVEDEDGVRRLARRVLEREGYLVLAAASAEEALRILEEHGAPVRLLLSDVILPGMNGPELARHLARARPGMKTIFMSGYTADDLTGERLVESAASFISKPFDLGVLVEQVRDALEVG